MSSFTRQDRVIDDFPITREGFVPDDEKETFIPIQRENNDDWLKIEGGQDPQAPINFGVGNVVTFKPNQQEQKRVFKAYKPEGRHEQPESYNLAPKEFSRDKPARNCYCKQSEQTKLNTDKKAIDKKEGNNCSRELDNKSSI